MCIIDVGVNDLIDSASSQAAKAHAAQEREGAYLPSNVRQAMNKMNDTRTRAEHLSPEHTRARKQYKTTLAASMPLTAAASASAASTDESADMQSDVAGKQSAWHKVRDSATTAWGGPIVAAEEGLQIFAQLANDAYKVAEQAKSQQHTAESALELVERAGATSVAVDAVGLPGFGSAKATAERVREHVLVTGLINEAAAKAHAAAKARLQHAQASLRREQVDAALTEARAALMIHNRQKDLNTFQDAALQEQVINGVKEAEADAARAVEECDSTFAAAKLTTVEAMKAAAQAPAMVPLNSKWYPLTARRMCAQTVYSFTHCLHKQLHEQSPLNADVAKFHQSSIVPFLVQQLGLGTTTGADQRIHSLWTSHLFDMTAQMMFGDTGVAMRSVPLLMTRTETQVSGMRCHIIIDPGQEDKMTNMVFDLLLRKNAVAHICTGQTDVISYPNIKDLYLNKSKEIKNALADIASFIKFSDVRLLLLAAQVTARE